MKEDILEQLTDDFLQTRGYFTRHNVKFLPDPSHPDFESKQDSNHSDIDVVGFNPNLVGPERVMAVSCKSWQGGFSPATRIRKIDEDGIISGRQAWRAFRELVKAKWAEAFREKITELTGESEFTYVTAVTRVKGEKTTWETHQPFLDMIGAPIRIITFQEMLDELWGKSDTTVASSSIGRTLQLIKASGWEIPL